MQLYYGSYAFPEHGTRWPLTQQLIEDVPGVPKSTLVTMDVSGNLEGTTPAELRIATIAIRAACLTPFQNVIVRHNGSIVEQMLNVDTITGVRCVDGPNFPGSTPGDFSTYRAFNCRFQAEYKLLGEAIPNILNYTQTVNISGGKPLRVWQLALNGKPKKTQVSPMTPYYAVQSGSATGRFSMPAIPGPLFLDPDEVNLSRTSPQDSGGLLQNYQATWEYRFSSVTPFQLNPGVPR